MIDVILLSGVLSFYEQIIRIIAHTAQHEGDSVAQWCKVPPPPPRCAEIDLLYVFLNKISLNKNVLNKGRGMCYPVCGMVHIKEPLLLIDKSSLCGGSGFPFSLSEWFLTICLTPYNRR